jgi:hypothetical protein
MNPFSTDHPMMTEPSALARRVQRRILVVAAGYFVYILLLGPLFALDGHGYLSFVPESIGTAVVLPATPVVRVPVLRRIFRDYLDWWYHDPNEPYSSPDWT